VWSRHCGRRHAIEYIPWDGDAIERVFGIIPVVSALRIVIIIGRAARQPSRQSIRTSCDGLARSLGVIGYSSRSSWSDDVLLETLLPLGKVDPGLRAPEMPLDLHSIAADARLLEEIGYDGLVVEETKHDPFILLALAAETTRTLKLGTSVAIAFRAVRP